MSQINADTRNVSVTGDDLLAARVAQIVSECPSGDNFQRALWLHDYILNHADYDDGLNYYTADGILMLGTGVCDGYSRAYNLLLAQAGIGHARVESDGHAWNAVELDESEWYHVDATWDDPGGAASPNYYYFGLPTELISHISSHVPDYSRECYFPDCVFYASNYYIRMDAMEWQNTVVSEIREEIDAGERTFTASLSGTYRANGKIYTLPTLYQTIFYGLSRYVLQQDGLDYHNRTMDITIDGYDFDAPSAMPIEAHFRLNETPSVFNLPSGVQMLENETLKQTNAVVVIIPSGCELIGNLALASMPNLDEVHIPASVTAIASDAFSGCRDNLIIVTPRNSAAASFASDQDFCIEFTN